MYDTGVIYHQMPKERTYFLTKQKLIFNSRCFYDVFSFLADVTKCQPDSLSQKELHERLSKKQQY